MDIIKLLGVGAGFVVIFGAIGLAWRQGVLTWQHVIVFCLGSVLAGVSGISAQADQDGKWQFTIGEIAKATTANNEATNSQANAIAALSQRADQLQSEMQSLRSVVAASARPGLPAPPPPPPPSSAAASAAVTKNLDVSREAVKRSTDIIKRLPRF